MNTLQGKVALITGGGSGIGLATAREFHAQGARVVIAGRDRHKLEAVATDLGPDVAAVPTDVTKLSDLDALMARTRETFGNLDILFVNAGITGNRTLAETDEAFFDKLMETNFKGAYFTIQRALPILNDRAKRSANRKAPFRKANLTRIWSASRISSNWDARYAKSPRYLDTKTTLLSTPMSISGSFASNAHRWLSGKNLGDFVPVEALAGKMVRINVMTPSTIIVFHGFPYIESKHTRVAQRI